MVLHPFKARLLRSVPLESLNCCGHVEYLEGRIVEAGLSGGRTRLPIAASLYRLEKGA